MADKTVRGAGRRRTAPRTLGAQHTARKGGKEKRAFFGPTSEPPPVKVPRDTTSPQFVLVHCRGVLSVRGEAFHFGRNFWLATHSRTSDVHAFFPSGVRVQFGPHIHHMFLQPAF